MDKKLQCPSTAAAVGARLLGVVGDDGRVAYISPTIVIDDALTERMGSTGLEKRFRFTGPCTEDKCPNWSRGRCGVIDDFVEEVPAKTKTLPHCAIRKDCRWFSQVGRQACYRCPILVTDSRLD